MSEFPSVLRMNNIPFYVYTSFCLLIHPLMCIWVVTTFLSIVNYTAVNPSVQTSVQVSAFSYFRSIPRNGITGSYGNSLRNCHIISHSSCTILHSHWQCTAVPISPHPYQHMLFSVLFSCVFFFSVVVIQMVWSSISQWFYFFKFPNN